MKRYNIIFIFILNYEIFLCCLLSIDFNLTFRTLWRWKYCRKRRIKTYRFWSEIGISHFLFGFIPVLFLQALGTGVVHFGTRLSWIWAGSIPVWINSLRRWFKSWNKRRRRQKPSCITNIAKMFSKLYK